MATPGDLVVTTAAVLGLSAATVAQYDRQLSQTGLRSKSGRGRSAARVTPQDAANLLIAILASPIAGPSIKTAAASCRTYGGLKEQSKVSERKSFALIGDQWLRKLQPGHSFAEALAALIDAAGHSELFRARNQEGTDQTDFVMGIRMDGPAPGAEILFYTSLYDLRRSTQSGRLVYTPLGDDGQEEQPPGDLYQDRRITFRTIRALGELVASTETTRASKRKNVP